MKKIKNCWWVFQKWWLFSYFRCEYIPTTNILCQIRTKIKIELEHFVSNRISGQKFSTSRFTFSQKQFPVGDEIANLIFFQASPSIWFASIWFYTTVEAVKHNLKRASFLIIADYKHLVLSRKYYIKNG